MRPQRFNFAPWLFLAPFLGVFSVFTIWPLLRSFVLALQQTYGPGTTAWVGLRNFQFLATDPLFWTAALNTLQYTLGSLFIQLPVALGLALLLNRRGLRGRGVLRLTFFAPSLVGLPFVAMLFAPIFEKRTGLLNASLHWFFPLWNPEFAWMSEYVMSALILAALWIYAGFNMVYFLAALQNVPGELLEAAAMDGAGPWQRFRHVRFPQAFRLILPPLGNDFVAMVKDSSLVSVLGVMDIAQAAKVTAAGNFRYFETYNVAALLYLTMTIGLSLVLRRFEARMRGR